MLSQLCVRARVCVSECVCAHMFTHTSSVIHVGFKTACVLGRRADAVLAATSLVLRDQLSDPWDSLPCRPLQPGRQGGGAAGQSAPAEE